MWTRIRPSNRKPKKTAAEILENFRDPKTRRGSLARLYETENTPLPYRPHNIAEDFITMGLRDRRALYLKAGMTYPGLKGEPPAEVLYVNKQKRCMKSGWGIYWHISRHDPNYTFNRNGSHIIKTYAQLFAQAVGDEPVNIVEDCVGNGVKSAEFIEYTKIRPRRIVHVDMEADNLIEARRNVQRACLKQFGYKPEVISLLGDCRDDATYGDTLETLRNDPARTFVMNMGLGFNNLLGEEAEKPDSRSYLEMSRDRYKPGTIFGFDVNSTCSRRALKQSYLWVPPWIVNGVVKYSWNNRVPECDARDFGGRVEIIKAADCQSTTVTFQAFAKEDPDNTFVSFYPSIMPSPKRFREMNRKAGFAVCARAPFTPPEGEEKNYPPYIDQGIWLLTHPEYAEDVRERLRPLVQGDPVFRKVELG